MSSNYPVNNERSSNSRRNVKTSFTQSISARMKNFFKNTKWFSSSTMSNSNGMERTIEEDVPESPPSKRMRFNSLGTSTRNMSTNTDSTEIYNPVQAGLARTPTPSTYSENKEVISNYNHNFSLSNNSNSVTLKRKSLDSRNDHSVAHGSTFYQGETMYGGASSLYMDSPNIKHTKNKHLHDNKMNHDVNIGQSTRRILHLFENCSSSLIEEKRILQCTNSNNYDNISVNKNDVTNNKSFAAKTQELHSPSLANILKYKQKARLMDMTRIARQLISSHSSSAPYLLPDNKSSTNREKKSKEVFTTKMKTKLTRPGHDVSVRETQPPLDLPSISLQIDKNNLPTFSQFSPKLSNNVKSKEPENNKLFQFSSPVKKKNDLINIKISPPKWSDRLNNNIILEKEKNMPSSAKSIMIAINEKHENNKENASNVAKPIPIVIDFDKWRCPTCMIKNDNLVESCVCCGEKKPKITDSSNSVVSNSITKPIDLDFNKWRCPTCLLDNDNSIESCGGCDKKKTDSSNTAVLSDSFIKPIDLEMWRCPTCMVENDNSIESCGGCGEKKPETAESSNKTIVSNSITKPIDLDKWRCPTCMIKNDNSIESCVCCGEKKPKKTESSNTAVVDSITKPIISSSNQNMSITASTLSTTLVDSQKDKWECPGCYVRNEKNINKCVCCETNKPGFHGITQNKGFNFSQTNKNAFKFGINPTDYTKLEKPTIEVAICNQDNNLSKPNETETHNKFTSAATTVAAAEPTVVPASVDPPVGVVTFIPVVSVAPVATTAPITSAVSVSYVAPEVSAAPVPPVAPIASSEPVAAEEPISATVPEVIAEPITAVAPLPLPASVFPTSSLSTGANVTTRIDNNEKQNSILPESSPMQPVMSAPFMNNRDSSVNGFQIASTSIEAQNQFSFSTAPPQGIQPVVQLFNSTPTTSSSLFLNIQVSAPSSVSNVSQISYASNPVTTSLSFFQSNNLISNTAPSTSSLFKRSETSTIGASNAVVSNPSVFSFGNNTQNLQPQSGSSKFNFSFASKNPGTPSIFSSPPFGSHSPNNIEGNKTYNLPVSSGNGLSGNTGMMNNILPGNGLSTGNPLESMSPGNGVVSMGDEATLNHMISGNNLLGDHNSSSTATGFHTQMNRDVWSPSITGANSFFTGNTTFNSPNSSPTPSRFGNPSGSSATSFGNPSGSSATSFGNPSGSSATSFGNRSRSSATSFGNPSGLPATSFGIATQMTVNLPPQNIFGSQPPGNTGGIFGAPRMPSSTVPTVPSFERNFGNPATPFNFGIQTNNGLFGQTQLQPNQPIVYNFGGQSNGMVPQVQFNMGSSPSTPVRRVRKAIRRTTQR